MFINVVIQFCDIMRSFWKDANICKVFFIVCLYMQVYALWLEIQLARGERVWDSINQFKPAIFLGLFQARARVCDVIYRGLFCIQLEKVNCDCSFWCYWWHCWSSLLKLSSHKNQNIEYIILLYRTLFVGVNCSIYVFSFLDRAFPLLHVIENLLECCQRLSICLNKSRQVVTSDVLEYNPWHVWLIFF